MSLSVYLVGAGLTKSLELSRRVPLMMDFISVMADYVQNDIILNTLITLELGGVYATPCAECKRFADNVKSDLSAVASSDRTRFANLLKGRSPESVEDLLTSASRVGANGNIWASGAATYFRYGINQLFATVGWDLNLRVLEKFLSEQFSNRSRSHTFVCFNYDLALDKAVEDASNRSWQPRDGYGFEFAAWTTEDPASDHPNSAARAFSTSCLPQSSPRIKILKPHGSLNWLQRRINAEAKAESHGESAEMLLPLDGDMKIRHWRSTNTFNYAQWNNDLPRDFEILIAPPTPDKQPVMQNILEQEKEALAAADEIFLLGYSLPRTDTDQRDLIKRALRGNKSLGQLIIVNYGADDSYFRDMSELFGCEATRFNEGFLKFVGCYSALSASTLT